MRGALDRSHEVATERRARLQQSAGLGVDIERGAIGGKARLQAHRHARGKLAAERRRSEQHRLGAALFGKRAYPLREHLGVCMREALIHGVDHLGNAGRGKTLRLARSPSRLAKHRHHLAAARFGELKRLADQFEDHRQQRTLRINLGNHPDVTIG